LDPGEGVTWKMIQQGAETVRIFLDQLGLPCFLKTSGGKGLHVVVPIKPTTDWDTAKGFSQAVVQHLSRTPPKVFVAKAGGSNRVGKIFIDWLRNGLGATTASAWSARARPGIGISVPVEWNELGALKCGDQWTIRSVQTRLGMGNEPWKAYAKSAKALGPAMKKLGYQP
jgi:bifunctional non-homologous end joining protein LigD